MKHGLLMVLTFLIFLVFLSGCSSSSYNKAVEVSQKIIEGEVKTVSQLSKDSVKDVDSEIKRCELNFLVRAPPRWAEFEKCVIDVTISHKDVLICKKLAFKGLCEDEECPQIDSCYYGYAKKYHVDICDDMPGLFMRNECYELFETGEIESCDRQTNEMERNFCRIDYGLLKKDFTVCKNMELYEKEPNFLKYRDIYTCLAKFAKEGVIETNSEQQCREKYSMFKEIIPESSWNLFIKTCYKCHFETFKCDIK